MVTNRPGIDAQEWGFPALVQWAGRAAETAQPSGTLNPGDRYVGDRYVMTLAGTPPSPAGDGSSPWGGLSGTALFCGDLLAEVMTAEVARFLGIMVAEREPTRAKLTALTTGGTP